MIVVLSLLGLGRCWWVAAWLGLAGADDPAVLVVASREGQDDVRFRPALAAHAVQRLRSVLAASGYEVSGVVPNGRPAGESSGADQDLYRHLEEGLGLGPQAVRTWVACESSGADLLLEVSVRVEKERTSQGRRTVRNRIRFQLLQPDGRLRFAEDGIVSESSFSQGFDALHEEALDRALVRDSALREVALLLDTLRQWADRQREEGADYRVTVHEGSLPQLDAPALQGLPGAAQGSVELLETVPGHRTFTLRFKGGRAALVKALQGMAAGQDAAASLRVHGRGRTLLVTCAASDVDAPGDGLMVSLRRRTRDLARGVYLRDPQWFDRMTIRFAPRLWISGPDAAPPSPDSGLGRALQELSDAARETFALASEQRVRTLDAAASEQVALWRERQAWTLDGDARLPESVRPRWLDGGARKVVLTGLDDATGGWQLHLSVVDLDSGWKESAVESLGTELSRKLDALSRED